MNSLFSSDSVVKLRNNFLQVQQGILLRLQELLSKIFLVFLRKYINNYY